MRPSPALASRDYVLLVSGTMNPPHIGHVRLGLTAADGLRGAGHTVRAICYLPVHDNYLCNKVVVKQSASSSVAPADLIAVPMRERCALLQALLASEPADRTAACHVLDYEHTAGDGLLAESPGYWAPKLPGGYLKTVPTTTLIAHFAANSSLMEGGARLGVVFGVDNLAGMASWNDPDKLLARADLVFLARGMDKVSFAAQPSSLLNALRHLIVSSCVPVVHGTETLFGHQTGSFLNQDAAGEGALFLLPPLSGDDEGLSSTTIRDALGRYAIGRHSASRQRTASGLEPAGQSEAQQGPGGGGQAEAQQGPGGGGQAEAQQGTKAAEARATHKALVATPCTLYPEEHEALVAMLATHGHPASSLERLVEIATSGEGVVKEMSATGKKRGEWVKCHETAVETAAALHRVGTKRKQSRP